MENRTLSAVFQLPTTSKSSSTTDSTGFKSNDCQSRFSDKSAASLTIGFGFVQENTFSVNLTIKNFENLSIKDIQIANASFLMENTGVP